MGNRDRETMDDLANQVVRTLDLDSTAQGANAKAQAAIALAIADLADAVREHAATQPDECDAGPGELCNCRKCGVLAKRVQIDRD